MKTTSFHLLALCLWLPALDLAVAESVTPDAIGRLPAGEAAAWTTYLERSQATARADLAALEAELSAQGMAAALPAPSGGDFKLSAKPGDPWFSGEEAKALADVILSYQTPAGGWSKHTGYSRGARKPGMQWSSQYEPGKSPHYLGTFDNRSTTEQLQFLASLWQATDREDCREGFLRGVDYVLAAQFPNGGWPQVYPLEGGYHDCITLNDDAMTHILELLAAIGSDDPRFALVGEEKRKEAAEALDRGLSCVRRMQVIQDGKRTAWCAQYEATRLEPAGARKMEPATLSGVESANLLKFLMTLPDPEPELVACIEDGLAWLERVKITGISRASRDGKTVYVQDPGSEEVYWARFYDLKDSRPLFPGRDGVMYDSFEEMAAKNRLGYDFYSTRPGSVVKNGQKKWRKMLAARR